MTPEDAVGLFLAVGAEREILCAAALACGLQTVDLRTQPSTLSTANIPSLIVTDQLTGPWEPAHSSTFSQYNAPTLLQVRDPAPPTLQPPPPDSRTAFVLLRPLRLDSATAALNRLPG